MKYLSNVDEKHFINLSEERRIFLKRKQFSLFSLSQIRKEKDKEKKRRSGRKSWLVLNLHAIKLQISQFLPCFFFFVTVCNFVVHDRCLKAVVSPCSSIAASLIKVRIPTVSVPPLFRATRDEVWILPSATYIYTPLRILMAASKVRLRSQRGWTSWTSVSALATRLWYFRQTLFL